MKNSDSPHDRNFYFWDTRRGKTLQTYKKKDYWLAPMAEAPLGEAPLGQILGNHIASVSQERIDADRLAELWEVYTELQ
jgi:hypothetical protein